MGAFDELKKGSTNRMMDLLIEDVFQKHQVDDKLKNLNPEKKEKIKTIISDIQDQVNRLMK